MSKILVTGGTGLVGRHLEDIMSNATYLSSQNLDLKETYPTEHIIKRHNPDVVIHLAARVGGITDNIAHPVEYLEDNILINTNVLRACHAANVDRVISILSTCIYPDRVESYPMSENQLFDGPPPPGNFAYAMSKRCSAALVDAYVQQYGKKWCYLIPCNLYGEHDKYEAHHSHFISALIKKLYEATDSIQVWGTGKPLRQFMHAEDLARVIQYMIENDIVDNFNVAPDYVYTIDEMTKIGLKACGKEDLQIEYDGSKPDGQYRKDVDSSKLLSVMGDFKFIPLDEGIRRVYDTFSERYNKS